MTRTPTQVASHAQKYFIRLNSINKDRRRTSIHDITTVKDSEASIPQGPIIGYTNGSPGESFGKPSTQVSQYQTAPSGVGQYGRTIIEQQGHLISAVGTPLNLPQPMHMAFGSTSPAPGQIVSGPPFNIGPMAYPMPHTRR